MEAKGISLEELKWIVAHLTPEELAQFRAWFEEFDTAIWDAQFEQDVKEGRLDKAAEQALAEFRRGRYRAL